jgi:hypothetical protein
MFGWLRRSDCSTRRLDHERRRRRDHHGCCSGAGGRSPIRLAASIVIEQNDEWLVGKRSLSNHSLDALLQRDNDDTDREETRELTAA